MSGGYAYIMNYPYGAIGTAKEGIHNRWEILN
jgi:hypothetical protein